MANKENRTNLRNIENIEIRLTGRNNKTKYSYKPLPLKSFFIFVLIAVMIFIEYYWNSSYLDEFLGILAAAYLIVFNKKIKRYDTVTIILLFVLLALGLVSNYFSGVNVPNMSIAVDAITQMKIILAFFTVKYLLSDDEKQRVLDAFFPIAKIWIIIAFFCSIISQFVNIGMTTREVRYGIHCFNFIFRFNFQFIAAHLVMMAAIVCSKKLSDKRRLYYYIMGLVAVAMNTKSQSLIFVLAFVVLFISFRRHNGRLKPVTVIFLMASVFYISQYQIDNYLAKENTARRVFYEYGIVNANAYFPFGSGFATYGSAEAAKNYSPLYFRYNFDEVWGMSPSYPAFLTDTYWASVLGQFGWIGLILMVIVYARIFISFTNGNFKPDQRAFLYAAFVQYVIHAIGSGIITSSPGMIGFMAIALCSQTNVKTDRTFNVPRLRIKI